MFALQGGRFANLPTLDEDGRMIDARLLFSSEAEPQAPSTTNGHEWTPIQTKADVFQLLVFIRG
jgi:hypothetical protein